jgi:hypothetical protein
MDIQVRIVADGDEKPAVGRYDSTVHVVRVCNLIKNLLIPEADHHDGAVVVGQNRDVLVVCPLARLDECRREPQRNAVDSVFSESVTLCH